MTLVRSTLFGLITYATYDLTNLATINETVAGDCSGHDLGDSFEHAGQPGKFLHCPLVKVKFLTKNKKDMNFESSCLFLIHFSNSISTYKIRIIPNTISIPRLIRFDCSFDLSMKIENNRTTAITR